MKKLKVGDILICKKNIYELNIKMKKLKEGDILICKKDIYELNDMKSESPKYNSVLNILRHLLFCPIYKKNKKYKINNISDYGGVVIYAIDDCPYDPIIENWIENIFYTDTEKT